jgi:hypothetical protein
MATTKLTVATVKNSKPDTILAEAHPPRGVRLVTARLRISISEVGELVGVSRVRAR